MCFLKNFRTRDGALLAEPMAFTNFLNRFLRLTCLGLVYKVLLPG